MFWPVFLNLTLPPLGFLALKKTGSFLRFILFHLVYLFIFYSLYKYLPSTLWGIKHLLILFICFLSWRLTLAYFTIKASRQIEPENHNLNPAPDRRVFALFIPIYALLSLTLSFYIIPVHLMGLKLFYVSSNSMEPNLQQGDIILTERLLPDSEIERTEIIIFANPKNKIELLTKRVIGIPGDRIFLQPSSIKIGSEAINITSITVNDNHLKITPLKRQTPLGDLKMDAYFFSTPRLLNEKNDDSEYLVLEENRSNNFVNPFESNVMLDEENYYLMGDNRDNSRDSRFYGKINRDQIIYRYIYTLFSINWQMDSCPELLQADESNSLKERYPEKWCSPGLSERIRRAKIRWQSTGKNGRLNHWIQSILIKPET